MMPGMITFKEKLDRLLFSLEFNRLQGDPIEVMRGMLAVDS